MTTYRTERCACGGSIRATSLRASGLAVATHNQTAGHGFWRMMSAMHDPRCKGMAGRCDSYRAHPGPCFSLIVPSPHGLRDVSAGASGDGTVRRVGYDDDGGIAGPWPDDEQDDTGAEG